MNTVGEFFSKVLLNDYHNIRVKSADIDKIICEFNNCSDMEKYDVENRVIQEFATDWTNKIYILWV